jgi:hypothetical protein
VGSSPTIGTNYFDLAITYSKVLEFRHESKKFADLDNPCGRL